jgi:hypothetical protein
MTRARSPLADQIIAASPNAYESLLVSGGTPQSARQLLGGVSASDLIAGKSSADAEGMLAGLWLWLDGLEESHRISQGLSSLTGSGTPQTIP